MRILPICLSVLLVSAGCYTTQSVTGVPLRDQLEVSRAPLIVRGKDGETHRVDPNTELRFLIRGGGITNWVEARDLWRSELGLSYEDEDGVFFVGWDEIVGAEVRNLSGGKTFGATVLTVAIIGVAVVLIVASAKGGGSLNPGSGSISSGRSSSGAKPAGTRVVRHRLPRRASTDVHVHVPLALLIAASAADAPPADAPPPPPPPPPPGDQRAPPPSGGQGTPPQALPAPPVDEGSHEAEEAAAAAPSGKTAVRAAPLFEGPIRRQSWFELIGAVGAGTELVRFEGYTGSALVGMRIRETVELAGGFRHVLAPRAPGLGGELHSGYIGVGRLGMHLWVDDRHRFALPIGVDAGAGDPVRVHLRVNFGLRYSPIRNLSIGLLPFNPTFNYYADDSEFQGAMRWTFPTTLEVGFVF